MYDRKPNCSYNCLIGMALKSSDSGRLPVGEIYRFFEREFPYFLIAPEPWKNSLRHSLSLGHYFRKFNSDKLVTKKGHLWEVDPQRASELDKEMYMFLARGMPENVPSSPQLSKLRMQMTQLLLDSIKNTPSGSSGSAHSGQQRQQAMLNSSMTYSRGRQGGSPSSSRSLKQQVPDVVMLAAAQSGAVFSDVSSRHRNVIYTSPSATLPMPSYHGGRQPVGCLLTSTPTKQPVVVSSPLVHSSGGEPRSLAPSNQMLQHQRPSISGGNIMCKEAYQLVQFCNHCTLGLDGTAARQSATTREPTSPIIQQHPLHHHHGHSTHMADRSMMSVCEKSNQQENPVSHDLDPNPQQQQQQQQQQQCDCPTEAENQDACYPFIVPPTAERNIPLSQLNSCSGAYQFGGAGPPKELTVTKYRPQSVVVVDGCKSCRSGLDEAVRPVVYDWNGWWKAERVLCMMNEESYMNYVECRSEGDMKRLLQKSSKQIRRSLNFGPPPSDKALDPTCLTPTRSARLGAEPRNARSGVELPKESPVVRTQCRVKKLYRPSWMKKMKIQRQSAGLATKTLPRASPMSARASRGDKPSPITVSTKSKVVEGLKLIVSISFRKLITERQMKKYCGDGGKYRIPTK